MEIKEARKQLKALGYKLRVRSLEWGPHATITKNGEDMPSMFVGHSELAEWQPAIDWKNELKEPVTRDGEKVYGLKPGK